MIENKKQVEISFSDLEQIDLIQIQEKLKEIYKMYSVEVGLWLKDPKTNDVLLMRAQEDILNIRVQQGCGRTKETKTRI